MFKDYFFWFSQPSSILGQADQLAGLVFAGCLVLGILLFIAKKFTKHLIVKKIWSKLFVFTISIGLTGLFWYGLRYENTPIFGRRYWAGIIILIGLLWFCWILKYLVFSMRTEKSEFEREQIRRKYLPNAKL